MTKSIIIPQKRYAFLFSPPLSSPNSRIFDDMPQKYTATASTRSVPIPLFIRDTSTFTKPAHVLAYVTTSTARAGFGVNKIKETKESKDRRGIKLGLPDQLGNGSSYQ